MLNAGLLSGMTNEQLKALLVKAQNAYIELQLGNKGVTFSYTQGDGTRSITYSQTSSAELSALILTIQCQLGISRRRAIGVRY